MKHLRHLFTALLLLCATTVAAHDFEVDGIYYNITDATNKTVAVTYKGTSYSQYSNEYTGNVEIPESVIYDSTTYSVTSIGGSAFSCCTGIASIEIPSSVTSIGGSAFSGCTGLTAVHISDFSAWCNIDFGNSAANPLSLAKNLYLNGELVTELVIPDGVEELKFGAFYDCTSLKNVTIPNSVTSIGKSAFNGCTGLTSVVIGNSVISIGSSAFRDCSGLTSVEIPNSVESVGSSAFRGCSGLTSVVIGNSVTSIGSSAFYKCSGLTSVEIPNSVTSIGNDAFYGCSRLKTVYNFSNLTFSKGTSDYGDVAYYANKVINAPNGFIDGDFIWFENESGMTLAGYLGNVTELTLPTQYNSKSVTSIGDDSFAYCTGLTSIVIPNSVTSIGDYAFYDCTGLTSVEIPGSVTSIAYGVFYGCSGLTSVEIPNSVESIGSYAFQNCDGLTSIEIPNSVTSIGSYAFQSCDGLTNVVIPNSITSIGNNAFRICTGLTSVEFNAENCTTMGNSSCPVFEGCRALSTVTIGENVKTIPAYAFYECSVLTSVVIPNSVTSIGDYAFYGCSRLKTIINFSGLTFSKGLSNYGYVAYYANKVINAPNGFIDGDFVWFENENGMTLAGYFGDAAELTIPTEYNGNSVTSIGNSAFYGCTGLTSVVIGNSVKSVGDDAFVGCDNVEKLDLSCAEIGNWFSGMSAIKEVTIGNGASSIVSSAFSGCTGLTSVVIGNGVTSIGDDAFAGCANIEKLNLDCAVIGNWFSGVSAIKEVTIGNNVAAIDVDAFAGCNGIERVVINDLAAWCGIDFGSATANPLYYANNLYLNGNLLTELVVPNSVAEIKDYAFNNCANLVSVTIPSCVTSVGDDAFAGCANVEKLNLDCAVIGNWFSGVSAIKEVTIGNNVAAIDVDAFAGCSGIERVVINDLAAWCGIDFGNAAANPLYYANNLYLNGNLLTELVVPNSVAEIKDYAFNNCANLVSVTIPSCVTSVGDDAFAGCANVEKLNLDCAVIGNWFSGVSAIKEVTIGNNVAAIDVDAFAGCSGIERVVINDLAAWCGIDFGNAAANPLYYAENLYMNGDLMTDVIIPASVTEIKDFAFYNCKELASVRINDNVTSIGDEAFVPCI